jgi:lipopolysaccharide transport system permease protein
MHKSSSKAIPVNILTAETPLRRPADLWLGLFRDLIRSRHVAWEMFRRDLISQYRYSLLGIFLSLLPALTTTLWAVMFRNANLIRVGDVKIPYPFYVLCGMMIWVAFLESIDAPVSGIFMEQGLISKASVPAEIVTVARILQVFFNFFVKIVVIAAAAVFFRVHVFATVILALAPVVLIVALGAGIGLILAPINLLYRDISRVMPVITTFWFFVTPIIFTSPDQGLASVWMRKLNPVTPFLVTARDLAFRGALSMRREVEWTAVFTMVLLFLSLTFHRIAMPIVKDRTNS